MQEHNTGIYAIRNANTGKVYIGSAVNFDERWRIHKVLLGTRKHHSKHLQSAWDKYGAGSFTFEKLLICSSENLTMYEQTMIDGHKAANRAHGYNARPTAESMLGFRHSPESRAKMSAKRKLQVFPAETRALWSKNRTGRKMPEWFGEFTRAHKTGTKHSEATKKLIGEKGIGRKASVSTMEKRSKLTYQQASEIKSRFAAGGVTQKEIAIEYSLHPSTISLLVRGKLWGGVSCVI